MPSVHDTIFEATAFPVLLAQFGESVSYHPSGGGVRVIDAIITRDPVAFYEGSKIIQPSFMLRVLNDATSGVSSLELDSGGDEIELPPKIGGLPVKRAIIKMMSQDSGVTTFAVR